MAPPPSLQEQTVKLSRPGCLSPARLHEWRCPLIRRLTVSLEKKSVQDFPRLCGNRLTGRPARCLERYVLVSLFHRHTSGLTLLSYTNTILSYTLSTKIIDKDFREL
jgi:hypothetical protein